MFLQKLKILKPTFWASSRRIYKTALYLRHFRSSYPIQLIAQTRLRKAPLPLYYPIATTWEMRPDPRPLKHHIERIFYLDIGIGQKVRWMHLRGFDVNKFLYF